MPSLMPVSSPLLSPPSIVPLFSLPCIRGTAFGSETRRLHEPLAPKTTVHVISLEKEIAIASRIHLVTNT